MLFKAEELILKNFEKFKHIYYMNTEAIKDSADIPEIKESPRSKSFNFSLDGNLGLQIGFLSGLGGILYYLFSCTCPS